MFAETVTPYVQKPVLHIFCLLMKTHCILFLSFNFIVACRLINLLEFTYYSYVHTKTTLVSASPNPKLSIVLWLACKVIMRYLDNMKLCILSCLCCITHTMNNYLGPSVRWKLCTWQVVTTFTYTVSNFQSIQCKGVI